jgi:hypothetical protein
LEIVVATPASTPQFLLLSSFFFQDIITRMRRESVREERVQERGERRVQERGERREERGERRASKKEKIGD